jgi:transcriptional regulator with XRE-family HTH domain
MGRQPIVPSSAVDQFLRQRRRSLGLTLRDVERQAAEFGRVIPFATLAKIERGGVDPGLSRLHTLLRLYNIPMAVAADLLDVEAMAQQIPNESDPRKLRELAERAWQDGRTGDALGCLLALRRETAKRPELVREQQEAVLAFAAFAGKLGKHQLSRQMLDELLTQQAHRDLLVAILVQQASSARNLGAPEAAFAYLDRAAVHLRHGNHRERGWVAHQRASLQASVGAFDEALKNIRQAIRAFQVARRPFDQGMAMAALARLEVESGNVSRGIQSARRATEFALRKGFPKVRLLAAIAHSRAHLLEKSPEPVLILLRSLLADAVASSDNVARFYAHFYLWKAYIAVGAHARAEIERREAVYHLRFTDEASEEAAELGGSVSKDDSQSKRG